jgi:hypothetical protein
MARIEAALATQIGDVVRPAAGARDAQAQREGAAQRSAEAPQSTLLGGSVGQDDLRAVSDQLKAVVEAASGRQLRFDVMQRKDKGQNGQSSMTGIGFAVDHDNDEQTYVAISDQKTGEVIKQIPTEEVRQLRARISEIVGLLLDAKA